MLTRRTIVADGQVFAGHPVRWYTIWASLCVAANGCGGFPDDLREMTPGKEIRHVWRILTVQALVQHRLVVVPALRDSSANVLRGHIASEILAITTTAEGAGKSQYRRSRSLATEKLTCRAFRDSEPRPPAHTRRDSRPTEEGPRNGWHGERCDDRELGT